MTCPSSVVGRLAPSPTGAQHVGNARTYLIAWLSARSRGGRVALRVEDIDSPRVKPGAADEACADLRWLGLDWDEGPVVQTGRLPLYEEALRRLRERELVYPCTCTRAAMGVTEVVRGDDLVPSTPRQLLLYRALGLTAPAFAHVPLVVGPDGRRLAKRHGDTRLAALRAAGVSAERLLGLLAWSCGWIL